MPNPTIATLSDAEAAAAQGTTHAGTGIKLPAHGASRSTSPTGRVQCTTHDKQALDLLAWCVRGMAVLSPTALNIQVYPVDFFIGATKKSFAGSTGFACTASNTNYVYLDSTPALQKDTTGWPVGDHYKIAEVVCDGSQVVSITNMAQANQVIGAVNNWWTFAPTAGLAMNDRAIDDVLSIEFSNPTDLTIASGIITPTRSLHRVDTEGAAASDDLDNITSTAGDYGMPLLLCGVSAARVVTVRDGVGNIDLANGNYALDDADKFILFMNWNGRWKEVARSHFTLTQLSANLDCNAKTLDNVGIIEFGAITNKTIASGVITVDRSTIEVLNEAAAAADDLDTINGGTAGMFLILRAKTAAQVVTVKHNTGNIKLANAKDYVMSDTSRLLTLYYDESNWNEVARHHGAADGAGTGNTNAYPIETHVSGNLSVGVIKFQKIATVPFVFLSASARVGTAPATQNIIVDVRKNGVSMFSSQGDMINITPGSFGGASIVKSPPIAFAVNDILTIEVEQVGSGTTGADMTVSIDAYTQPVTPAT